MSSWLLPKNVPQTTTPILAMCAQKLLNVLGWKIVGEMPNRSKFIVAVAPHTSNWDFFLGLAVMFALQLKVKFLGKHSIFVWPVKGLLIKVGGIPVERSHKHGVVGQMVERFEQSSSLVLALAPEGTRSKVDRWKTGFLHIAHQANVPVVPIAFDFKKKTVEILPQMDIGANIEQALNDFKENFVGVCAKNPHLV